MVSPRVVVPAGRRGGPGKKKARSHVGAGRGFANALTSPGRSPGADEIEIQICEIEVAVHASIIGDSPDSVNRLVRVAVLHLTASSEFRSLKIPLSQKTFVMSPDFMSLGLIVVVLLGVLLTVLPVSQGVRGALRRVT